MWENNIGEKLLLTPFYFWFGYIWLHILVYFFPETSIWVLGGILIIVWFYINEWLLPTFDYDNILSLFPQLDRKPTEYEAKIKKLMEYSETYGTATDEWDFESNYFIFMLNMFAFFFYKDE